jgi:hypothetical protein
VHDRCDEQIPSPPKRAVDAQIACTHKHRDREGGEVHDRRDVLELEHAAQRLDVADVALVERRRAPRDRRQVVERIARRGAKVVEHDDVVPALQQAQAHVRAHKAAAAGHEHAVLPVRVHARRRARMWVILHI